MHSKYEEILLNGGAFVVIKIAPEMKKISVKTMELDWVQCSVVFAKELL